MDISAFRNRLASKRSALLLAALAITAGTIVLLSVAIGTVRTRAFFDQIIRRVEIRDRRGEYDESFQAELHDAARYARSDSDWRTVFRLAWRLPIPERWHTVEGLSRVATGSMPNTADWYILGAFAALQQGHVEESRGLLLDMPASERNREIVQFMLLLLAAETEGIDEDLQRILDSSTEMDLVSVVHEALTNPNAETLYDAWQQTEIAAFGINSALHAAHGNDRETVNRVTRELRPDTGTEPAYLYLAAWTADNNWLFSQLRRASPRNAVSSEALLLQADALIRQSQWREARLIHRELQQAYPGQSSIPYINDAILTARLDDGDPVSILRAGERYHRNDPSLLVVLAAFMIRRGMTEDALERLERLEETMIPAGEYGVTTRHATWLLQRIVRARREVHHGAPPERVESDLWMYINDNPEAQEVAAFLARLLHVRGGDASGQQELRRRYPPQTAPWAATMHIMRYSDEEKPGEAEPLLEYLFPVQGAPERGITGWVSHYNRALFALRYLPILESEAKVRAFRTWLEQDSLLPGEIYNAARRKLRLLEAELARIQGDSKEARRIIDRGIASDPSPETLHTYRALLAPED